MDETNKWVAGTASEVEDRPRTPLENAMEEHGAQLGKLRGLIDELHMRLRPVRNVTPAEPEPSPGQPLRNNSPHVMNLQDLTDTIRGMQSDLGAVLSELEV